MRSRVVFVVNCDHTRVAGEQSSRRPPYPSALHDSTLQSTIRVYPHGAVFKHPELVFIIQVLVPPDTMTQLKPPQLNQLISHGTPIKSHLRLEDPLVLPGLHLSVRHALEDDLDISTAPPHMIPRWKPYEDPHEDIWRRDDRQCRRSFQRVVPEDPVCLFSVLSSRDKLSMGVQGLGPGLGLTIFLCRVTLGSHEVIICVRLSTGRPRCRRTRSICGMKSDWGRHQAVSGRMSGQAALSPRIDFSFSWELTWDERGARGGRLGWSWFLSGSVFSHTPSTGYREKELTASRQTGRSSRSLSTGPRQCHSP